MNVAVIGCGVRGSIVAALLAGAGVEELALVDGAFVEEGDIGVNPLQFTPDLRAGKADALVAKLGLLNPRVHAQAFPADLDAANAVAILTGVDCVVDCAGVVEISEAIELAAKEIGIPVVAPAEDFVAEEDSVARAVAVGADQAGEALALRTQA
ncbi:MAG: ThiF family adenylyltransferase [Solirubrobacterales bacterium]|nr:ThiF family adenylyltransferase [Solirubrobacterales bacterium]